MRHLLWILKVEMENHERKYDKTKTGENASYDTCEQGRPLEMNEEESRGEEFRWQ